MRAIRGLAPPASSTRVRCCLTPFAAVSALVEDGLGLVLTQMSTAPESLRCCRPQGFEGFGQPRMPRRRTWRRHRHLVVERRPSAMPLAALLSEKGFLVLLSFSMTTSGTSAGARCGEVGKRVLDHLRR